MSDQSTAIIRFSQRYAERAARRACVGPSFKHLDQEDVAAEVLREVVRAMPNFDPRVGTIEVFFGKVIDDALKMIQRRERGPKARAQRMASLDELKAEPVDPATDAPGGQEDLTAHVEVVLRSATPEEKEVARLSCNLNVAAIARAMGLTRSEVRTLRRRLGNRFGDDFFRKFANWDSARRDQ